MEYLGVKVFIIFGAIGWSLWLAELLYKKVKRYQNRK
tara:strand:- start:174 stop:284 length:111 start_codon:yes stop_codon:yes gene_type:complete